jgi:hypothetical protein
MRNAKWIAAVLLIFCATPACAQFKRPVPTRNAALRYWLAFADLQDPPADKAVTDLLEKTAAGEAPWDEAKLGPILDQNDAAILGMQRASKLPECDWGIDYEAGPTASIAYVPRARVLARLNTLYGIRLASKGDTQKAVDTWLAGIRFSQHLAQGGSLIFALVAKTALLSNFQALTQAAQNGKLSEEQRREVAALVRALPETGFDWGQAMWFEQDSLDLAEKRVAEAANPSAFYQELTGERAPEGFAVPKPSEVAAFHKAMGAAEAELRASPKPAAEKLKELQDSVRSLHPFYVALTPSFTHVNGARIQIADARETLLHALASR